jgi:hypothetical protein
LSSPKLRYRVEIPQFVVNDPVQAVVDGLTIIHNELGLEGVERALEAVLEVVYPN